jgi:L-lactate dehydrogenase complex protein LldG
MSSKDPSTHREPSSRSEILAAVRENQPDRLPRPEIDRFPQTFTDLPAHFESVLKKIGGTTIHRVQDHAAIIPIIEKERERFPRIVSYSDDLSAVAETHFSGPRHDLKNVDLAILESHLGVAENGAVWVTDAEAPLRVLPFICQHLAVIVREADFVATMHDAYDRIGGAGYGFGTFIAGPSKTADIEQSLVLGAHGPKSMTVFIVSYGG